MRIERMSACTVIALFKNRVRFFLASPSLRNGMIVAIAMGSCALISCSRQKQPPLEVLRSDLVLREGRLFQSGRTNLFTGSMIEFYHDGRLKSRSVVSNGQLQGVSEGWYTNGQIQVREYFRKGISDGIRSKWHENGKRMSEATIVAGKLHGLHRRWDENGLLAEEVSMKEGFPEGLSRAYYPSGFLKAQARLQEGVPIEQQFWRDGEMKMASNHLKGAE